MSKLLVIAEHDGRRLAASTAKCVSCASEIPEAEIDIVVLSDDGAAVAEQASQLAGIDRVLLIRHDRNRNPIAAILAPQIAELAADYTHVLGPSTTFGKDLLPRIAALLEVGQISDIMAVRGAYRFIRPIYAGNAILTVDADTQQIVVGTVRTASFNEAPQGGDAKVELIASNIETPEHTRYVGLQSGAANGPDLQTATRVVAGGRGVGSAENFESIRRLAQTLNAAVGASRAAVDAGFVSNDLQVGQTGKIIAPELYVAIGISGAIQHITGIKDAGTIVAINKDADAPIFDVADIGLVGDLFDIVPALLAELEKIGGSTGA